MTILAIDTTGVVCSAALLRDSKVLGEYSCASGRNHSVQLMPMTDALLENCGVALDEVDVFAAVTGPGSFTGIRIGVAAVKALAQVKGKPCCGIDTLELLAENAFGFGGAVCPIIDARAQQAYTALFEDGKRVMEDRAVKMQEFIPELKALGKKVLFLGDGVIPLRPLILREMGEQAVFMPEHLLLQRSAAACVLAERSALAGRLLRPEELFPAYVKASQAEREAAEKSGGKLG